MIEQLARVPVDVDYASEFRYRDPVMDENTLLLVISQSGETADTIAALREAKELGTRVLAICNVHGSMIVREADGAILTHAGPEIGVASTKAFTSQIVAFLLLGLYLGRQRGALGEADGRELVAALAGLPHAVAGALALDQQVRGLAERYAGAQNCLYLGRGVNFPVALEGALKLKEISYLHAEGFAAGEMKHGPIALIEQDLPVVAVATRGHVYAKTISNIQEVKARGAFVIAVCSEGDRMEVARHADRVLEVPHAHELLIPALVTVPLQLLAYEVATLRGCDVDQPRNLAKSVTVE